MPTQPEIIGHCWHCGSPLSRADYGRETNCLTCAHPTRCCRNCRHYARGRPNDCVEPLAEPVADKTRANFCEHFDPAAHPGAPAAATDSGTADLRAAAEALFK